MNVTSEEFRALKPIVVATVGPTNEGKTSLLRTLTGDPNFGLVNAFNGTTVRAEIQKVFYKGIAEILQLVDTPGFQNSGEILELLSEDETVEANGGAFDLDDILRVVPPKDDDFRHDLRAWTEVARCDVVIFVVNVVEDPGQSLVRNTLRLLKNIGKPVVVAYNNVFASENDGGIGVSAEISANGGENGSESGANGGENGAAPVPNAPIFNDFRAQWDAILKKNGFYLIQPYDAHRRSFANEIALFEKIAALVEDPLSRRVLRLEILERQTRELRRLENSRTIVAELLLDVAAYRALETNVARDDWRRNLERLEETLKQNVVKREHEAQLALLETWGFRVGVLNREMLVVDDVSAKEKDEIFGLEARRRFKAGAAVGAALGAAIDVATFGASLGGGIALGGLIGGALGGGGAALYSRRYDEKNKKLVVRPQKEVAELLLARAVDLIQKLQTRGKALEDSVQALVSATPRSVEIPGLAKALADFADGEDYSKMNENVSPLKTADWRRLPVVSALAKERKTRDQAVASLAAYLKKALPDVEI